MIRDTFSCRELIEFLRNPESRWDMGGMMDVLLKSDLYTVVSSDENLSHLEENGVIPLLKTLPKAYTGSGGFAYAAIFTSEDEIRVSANAKGHPYLQMVNLPELIHSVLLDDLDGIVLNRHSHNITIPRRFLMEFFREFSTPNTAKYDDYAFIIE